MVVQVSEAISGVSGCWRCWFSETAISGVVSEDLCGVTGSSPPKCSSSFLIVYGNSGFVDLG